MPTFPRSGPRRLRLVAEGGFPLFDQDGQMDEEDAGALGVDDRLIRDLTDWSDESQLIGPGPGFATWGERGQALRGRVQAAVGDGFIVVFNE